MPLLVFDHPCKITNTNNKPFGVFVFVDFDFHLAWDAYIFNDLFSTEWTKQPCHRPTHSSVSWWPFRGRCWPWGVSQLAGVPQWRQCRLSLRSARMKCRHPQVRHVALPCGRFRKSLNRIGFFSSLIEAPRRRVSLRASGSSQPGLLGRPRKIPPCRKPGGFC